MHSIRVKITAVTISAIIISILTLGFIGVATVTTESDRNSVHEMNLIADDEKNALDTHLMSLQQSVETVAHLATDQLNADESVRGALTAEDTRTPEQAAQLDAALEQQGRKVQEIFGSIANHTRGIVTYYYCINPDVGKPDDGFFYSKVGKEDFERQESLDATTLNSDDMDHYTWYFTPMKTGKACWVGPYRAHFLGEAWTVSYVTPVFADGVAIGVLGMDILLDDMISQVSDITIYDTGFVALLGTDGRILYHPEYATGSPTQNASAMLQPSVFEGTSSTGRLIRYMASNGEERQLAFSTLANDMKLVAVAPVSELTESQRHMTQIFVLVAVLLLAFFSVFSFMSMRAVTEPLLRLTAASQRLAAGDYDAELDYDGNDEVGTLTEAFRRMRDNLKLYIGDLNSRATTDALTGVKNKSAFNADAARLDKAIEAWDPYDDEDSAPEFAIVMFDCNRLKVINDDYGHDHGDLYLRAACKAICQTYTHSPVYRIGGDEFAALLERQDYADRDKLELAFRKLAEETNASASDPWERVDIAMGTAVFEPGSDKTAEDVLHRADELMYLEKRLYKLSLK